MIPRLWFAGQVNGTLGYAEAAGEDLVAGPSAGLAFQGLPRSSVGMRCTLLC
jgi:tRNA U34 5-carboxymethylaminomethyl modifying enzyme MnmG/GidA